MSDPLPRIRRMIKDQHGGHWPPSPVDVDWLIAEVEQLRKDRELLRQEAERLKARLIATWRAGKERRDE